MQIRPRLACKIACFAVKNACNSQAKTLGIAGKNTRKINQKYLQSQAKIPAVAGNLLPHRGYIQLRTAGKLTCIPQVKLPSTFVIYYLLSRVFCVKCLPRRNRKIYLFLHANCVRGFCTYVASRVLSPTFAENATVF